MGSRGHLYISWREAYIHRSGILVVVHYSESCTLYLVTNNVSKTKVASSPGPPSFPMLHAEDWEDLGDHVTCMTFQINVDLSCMGTCGIDNRN